MCSLTRNLCLCPNTVSVNLSSQWTTCKAEALHLPVGSPLTAKHQLRLSSPQGDLIRTGMKAFWEESVQSVQNVTQCPFGSFECHLKILLLSLAPHKSLCFL